MESRLSDQERGRLAALLEYDIVDTEPEADFDDFTVLAAEMCDTPIAIITLLDDKRQWFKSRIGLDVAETPRAVAFCDHTIAARQMFIVEDSLRDARFRDNPLVLGEPYIRFYAGAPLIDRDGHVLGTLSVIDRKPRRLRAAARDGLTRLSHHVMVLLELRRNLAHLRRAVDERERAQQALRQIQKELEIRVAERSTALRASNESLRQEIAERIKEKRFCDAIINSLPGIFYVFDADGRFLRWNDNFAAVTGYSHQEIQQMHPLDFFAGEADKQLIRERIAQVFAGAPTQVEASLRTREGASIPYLFNGARVQIDERFCLCGMGLDISERLRSETRLREAEERYRRLIELSPDAIFVMHGERCSFANRAGLRMLGARSQRQLAERSILDLVHPASREQVRLRIQSTEKLHHTIRIEQKFIQLDGTQIDAEVAIAPFVDGGQPARLVVARDITESNRYKLQLEHQANFDALTHLANRRLLADRIRQAIAYAHRHQTLAVVAFIDLDNFKLINDTLGHNIGDQLLVCVAERIKSCVREGDTVARHGGDEFALVLTDHQGEDAVAAWVARLLQHVSQPFSVEEHQLVVTCSIGLSVCPRDGAEVDTLLKHADAAMYQAKAAGRNQFRFFIPSMNERVRERFTMEAKLRQALELGQFALHYQPQMNLASGAVTGIEALIRWTDPDSGAIPPQRFIYIAEETGLIVPIGQWVLEQACIHNRRLQDAGLAPVQVSVNLSPRQFAPDMLIESVQRALSASGLAPQLLKLEVTEGTVMTHPEEAQDILRDLKRMGVSLAIDDFGVGYSSLSYLQRFPVDQLKIDQSFVQRLASDANDAAITQAVISLGHSLGLEVVAEGVSSPEQMQFLRTHGCDTIQGNYFCPAIPFAQLQRMLAAPRAPH